MDQKGGFAVRHLSLTASGVFLFFALLSEDSMANDPAMNTPWPVGSTVPLIFESRMLENYTENCH